MNEGKIFVAVVCGPTASGKTALAVQLAKRLDGEVVSADSMQIYTGMQIASAKPTKAEMQGVAHHLMDFLPPTEPFSVADYVRLAREAVFGIASRGRLPILCGGTGLYIRSLLQNIHFDDTESDEEFRGEMQRLADENGADELWGRLNRVDPEAAAQLHPNNRNRIIRALEINRASGKTLAQAAAESRAEESPFRSCMIMPDYPREQLYERINCRVDAMISAGLVEEAREFFTHDDYQTAAQAIGYKELKPFLDGEKSLEECVLRLKQVTRNYAKRQLTWFRREPQLLPILAGNDITYEKIFQNAENLVKRYSI